MLSYNEVELKDSFFLILDDAQTTRTNFLSVSGIRDQGLRSLNPTAYFQAQFRLTNRVIEYERVIYSFFDMAGDVGGFGEFLHITFFILVGGFANRMFIASLIQDLFRVRLDIGDAKIDDLANSVKKKS